jgi:hypothetical protein
MSTTTSPRPVVVPAPSRARTLVLARRGVSWPAAIAAILIAAGVALWWVSLSAIHLDRMTDIGMASVLPPATWASFVLVTAGCALAWRCENTVLLVMGILATILVLYGLGVLAEPTMRFATTWQHVGIADYIAQHGTVDPHIDAYFNWPGFFILSGFLSTVAGLHDIEPIARAAPLFYNAMYLLPLVAIGNALFSDRRVVWLGVWMFFVSNWIGQDYFSPQGLGFFFYLVVIAVLLRRFKGFPRARFSAGGRLRRRSGKRSRLTRNATIPADVASTGGQRVLLLAAILLIVVAIVGSHQLTPFALIGATAALTVIGWCRARTLWVAMLLITLLWAAYLATTYLSGHLAELTGQVGAVNTTVNASVGGRLHGSAGHEFIVKLRLVTILVLWFVAMLGFLRRARSGALVAGTLVLAVSPFPLLGLQSYGGEVLLRIALFSMPFMSLSAASLFVSARPGSRVTRPAWVALALFGVLLVTLFPFNRYGNERMDSYSKQELAAVNALYRIAPSGSALFAASWALPWRYREYADYYYYSSLTDRSPEVDLDDPDRARLAREVAKRLDVPGNTASFLVITNSTAAQSDLFGPWRPGAQLRLRQTLARSPLFRIVYQNPDAVVFQLK